MSRITRTTGLWLTACLLSACGGGGGGSAGGASNSIEPTPAVTPVTPVTPEPAPASIAAAATQAGMSRLVWADEFSADGLPDASKWSFDTERNRAGWFNNEKQYYAANRLENARVQGGLLTITARKESLSTAPDYGNQAYTSARLISRGKASWQYGFFEVRAKLPCSLGTWPAIWMLGTGGRWPEDGEIDIMEQKGFSAFEKTQVSGTIHTKGYNYFGGTYGVGQGASSAVANTCGSFHNYQLVWTEDKIVIGVDDTPYFEFLNPKDGDSHKWPFNNPQFMILNVAMGGDLGGAIPVDFVSDQMVLDYVRVYQR